MNKSRLNILYKLLVCELLFLIILRLLQVSIIHDGQDLIYYINLNLKNIKEKTDLIKHVL